MALGALMPLVNRLLGGRSFWGAWGQKQGRDSGSSILQLHNSTTLDFPAPQLPPPTHTTPTPPHPTHTGDLVLDVPDAPDLLALFMARAVVDDVLPPAIAQR